MKTKKLFVQNISAFLVGFNPPAGVDKILKMFAETIDVNCTYKLTGKETAEDAVA